MNAAMQHLVSSPFAIMLSQPEVQKYIESAKSKTDIVKLARAGNIAIPYMLDLTLHTNKQIAFRSAWVLENIVLSGKEEYLPYLQQIISYGKQIGQGSCQRHYAKIYAHFTLMAQGQAGILLNDADTAVLIELCFDWLIKPDVKPAVKMWAAETLFNLKQHAKWITEELAGQLKYLMRNGSPAIQIAGRRLLKRLQG